MKEELAGRKEVMKEGNIHKREKRRIMGYKMVRLNIQPVTLILCPATKMLSRHK